MVSESALAEITKCISAGPEDTLVEVGPGLGFLTELILPQAGKVIAVEKDKRFAAYLRKNFATEARLEVIETDILQWDPTPLAPAGAKIVGNIPYQISSPLLEWIEKYKHLFTEALFTYQKEFAERLAAPPGRRETGALSIWMHLHAEIEIVAHFPRTAFFPEPQVDAELLRIRFLKKPHYEPGTGEALHQLIRKAFQQRRKMLSNTLGAPLLEKAGISPTLRPEDLKLEDWVSLGRVC